MKEIEGQISLFDMLNQKNEPPILLNIGQEVYIVIKGDVKKATVFDEKSWLCGEDDRGYRLIYENGIYDCIKNSNINKNVFLSENKAINKAEEYMQNHDVILAKDIHPIYIASYQYVRKLDGRIMTAFYCELDNDKAYLKDFMTFHYVVDVEKKKKAVKKFFNQQEFQYNDVEKIEYNPTFKNMYRINQQYDWDYSEAGHSYAIG